MCETYLRCLRNLCPLLSPPLLSSCYRGGGGLLPGWWHHPCVAVVGSTDAVTWLNVCLMVCGDEGQDVNEKAEGERDWENLLIVRLSLEGFWGGRGWVFFKKRRFGKGDMLEYVFFCLQSPLSLDIGKVYRICSMRWRCSKLFIKNIFRHFWKIFCLSCRVLVSVQS